jgi:hypothetical protein
MPIFKIKQRTALIEEAFYEIEADSAEEAFDLFLDGAKGSEEPVSVNTYEGILRASNGDASDMEVDVID